MNKKTAISIPNDIFIEVDGFAKEHNCSRSEVFATAAKEFLEKIKSANILNDLNAAYSEAETADEFETRARAKKHFAKTVIKGQSD